MPWCIVDTNGIDNSRVFVFVSVTYGYADRPLISNNLFIYPICYHGNLHLQWTVCSLVGNIFIIVWLENLTGNLI